MSTSGNTARGFFPLEVAAVERQTEDSVAVALTVPPEHKERFGYRPGQFLTLRQEIGGEDVRRTYSLCSAPDEALLRVGIKEIPDGRFSTFANRELRAGDVLEVMPPDGRFGTLAEDVASEGAHYLGIAAGSGITPILSIVKSTLRSEADSRFTLIYGNRTTQSVMFREELEGLKNRYPRRLQLFYIMSRERQDIELLNGRIDEDKCERLFGAVIDVPSLDAAFLCGPQGMVETARESLAKHGMAADRVKAELFTVAGAAPPPIVRREEATGDVRIEVKLDGHSTEIFGFRDEYVLDTALRAGLDLPFACKGGVCCTCKAKLIDGNVEMSVNYGLEPDEIADNYVLTCQALPRTDTVAIDYDG
ncbi:MAG: 1,2-phenylacetyl-CoA epoxidase subunit PaaE [Myxococcota bacterium]